ncbi:Pleiotropic drug resistance protein transporter [Phytophthora cinnamomi]|uniref:Pleiotropic drug resistance protein transporter n=1 Tax=Phytophthora cinnamomi TaxID=4785 RepID=UPI00355A5C0B|nr:Pleiotropic drug resistance protein transporter [Phytophthora cinnamomi]
MRGMTKEKLDSYLDEYMWCSWFFSPKASIGHGLVLLVSRFVSALIFMVIFFPMLGYTGFWTGFVFWINASVFIMMQSYLGQFFAYAFPSEEVAVIVDVLVNSFFLFMGFSPPAYAIRDGYRWLYKIDSLVTVGHITLNECTEQYFGMKHDEIGMNFGIALAYIVLFRVLALRFINHHHNTLHSSPYGNTPGLKCFFPAVRCFKRKRRPC